MPDKITIALLAAVITAIGWLVNDYLARKREDRTRRFENRMKRYETQIKEFYGPIFSLIHQLHNFNRIQHLILETSEEYGRSLTEGEIASIYRYFEEKHFIPLHLEILEILKGKLYLLNNTEIPSNFYDYLRHATQLSAQKGLFDEKRIDSSYLSGFNFPDAFFDEIKRGMESTLKRYEKCLTSLEIER